MIASLIPGLGLGLLVGAVLGLVGGGGSIVAVPALVYGAGMSSHDAIPTSLFVVGLSSLAALIPRVRSNVNWRIAAMVAAAGIPAAWAGTAAGRLVPPNFLMLAFATIMVVAGVRMLGRQRAGSGPCTPGSGANWFACPAKSGAVGILVGFLTGLLGVGGGFLITPALTLFLGLSMAEAVGTSLVIIVVNSAAGFSAHAVGFTIDWPVVLAFTVPAILGSLATARVAGRLKDRHVRVTFAGLIFAVAAWVAAGTLLAMAGG